MTSIERTAYPRFKRTPTSQELKQIYSPTSQEMAFVQQITRGDVYRFNLTVLLKAFQRLDYFPRLEEIPDVVVQHIRTCLGVSSEVVLG